MSIRRQAFLMAKLPRQRPARLPAKLRQIRLTLNLSQNEMLKTLGLEETSNRSAISGYEIGEREPSLVVLLKYAKAAGCCTDALIDDSVDLPSTIPSTPIHTGLGTS
jgi:transcriptional regulator with XRE-family HTH domain